MKSIIIIIAVLLLASNLYPQNNYKKEYITIIPGERYKASGFYEFWFGKHWRDVWTTPISVEVLNLKNFASGLTPVKKGGGYQTKSLRFKGNDGRLWKFRSLDKDPTKVLPPELHETVAADIIQDQVSSANPLAPFVVCPLLDAVGILNAKPILVYLPDDDLLGEFREEFGGLLGIIEEHPNVTGEDDDPGFENALDVKGTYNLLDHIEKKRKQKIDSEEFLKARLLDILLNDWDRHMDQWRWAKYKEADGKVWFPIPRDRDQVFSKYDGIFPSLATYVIPQLNNFGYDYPDMEDLTWNGRFIDRRALTELDKNTWDSVTAFVQNNITDSLIEYSVTKLPPKIYEICATEIIEKLKSRRSKLAEASNSFYNLVNKYADVFCSAEDDYVEVNRIDDNYTEVTVFRRDKESGGKKGNPLFHKVFNNQITVDIRIRLNDGDDKAIVYGECNEGPIVRIIGGKGKDELIDESLVEGYFLSITPFRSAQSKTYFYDSGEKTIVTEGSGTTYDDNDWPEPTDELEKYEPRQLDRGHNWMLVPVLGLDTDYGLTVGGGVALHKYNFRAIPEEYLQQLTVSYATRFGNLAAAYTGDFYSLVRDGRLNLLVTATEQYITRYFGYGNETPFSQNLENNNYYRVNQKLFTLFPTLFYNFNRNITGSFGLSFVHTYTSLQNDTLLSGFRYKDYGLGSISPFAFHLGIDFDGRDNENYPTNGYLLKFYGRIFPPLFDVDEPFYFTGFDMRSYLTPEFTSFLTLALRAGGSKVFGKYPFYAGATVGGPDNLRGYYSKRFSGDADIFGQTELRIFITQIKLILKGRFGINIFAEAGRVFTENDMSDKWHPSYGAGMWVSYLDSMIIGSTYVAFSPERTTFYLGLGMGF